MKRFIYNGLYYPVIGTNNGWATYNKEQVWEYRIGGWKNADKWWSFSVGIKCLLKDPEKPYKQFVIDAIRAHKNMEIITKFYDDECNLIKISTDIDQLYNRWGMSNVYTKKGEYIGTIRDAYYLTHLTDFKTSGGESNQICIGWDKVNAVAYGWSHRAMFGFKEGDMVFEENYGSESIPFNKHGRKVIRNYTDAMKSALNFARYVS